MTAACCRGSCPRPASELHRFRFFQAFVSNRFTAEYAEIAEKFGVGPPCPPCSPWLKLFGGPDKDPNSQISMPQSDPASPPCAPDTLQRKFRRSPPRPLPRPPPIVAPTTACRSGMLF